MILSKLQGETDFWCAFSGAGFEDGSSRGGAIAWGTEEGVRPEHRINLQAGDPKQALIDHSVPRGRSNVHLTGVVRPKTQAPDHLVPS